MFFEGIERFRQRLAAGENLCGISIYTTDPQVSEAVADSVDFLWIDLEHASMGIEAVRGHLLAARSRRCPVVVRTASSDIASIKPILDAGAPGIVVPQVSSAEEVQRVVDACRYPPQGKRGFGPFIPSDYGRRDEGYVERANAAVFVAVMIECTEAVDAIEEIVAIDGLDSIVIGPMDLSGSLGVLGQADHPEVVAGMEKAIAAARRKNMPVGSGMPADPVFAAKQAARGIQWMQVGVDLSYLTQGVDATMKSLGDALK